MGKSDTIRLQVQIVAFRQEGIDRVASHSHPRVEGVRWLVSLQDPDGDARIPAELAERDDFDIIVSHDVGVARNRNHAQDFPCDSELVLLSDDDVDYTAEGLAALIESFDSHPDADMLCFRYTNCGKYPPKIYGKGIFSLDRPPRGWYPSLIEMAYRRSFGAVRFNERIGPGSELIAGEDTIWYHDMLRHGARGYGIPVDLCAHNQPPSGTRLKRDPRFVFAQGACFTHIFPCTWLPRLAVAARRSPLPFLFYMRHALRGAAYAFRTRLFKAPRP